MPWASTRIVPSELDAVFTVAAEEVVVVVACVAGAAAFVVVEFDELLPHAASARDAARTSGVILIALRIASLPLSRGARVCFTRLILKTPRARGSFPFDHARAAALERCAAARTAS